MENWKQNIDAKGFIQHLNPQKTSRKGNQYYKFQVKTSPQKAEKIVAYSSAKYEELQKFQLCKSSVKTKRLNLSDSTAIFNDESVVSKLNQYDKILTSHII